METIIKKEISIKLMKTINLANIELKKISDFILENQKALCSYMNLKLHDLNSYYCCSQFEKDFPLYYESQDKKEYGAFYWFCDDNLMFFNDWVNENKIDFREMRNDLGRTSSFYLDDNEKFIELDKNDKLDFNVTIENILNYNYGTMEYINIDDLIVDEKININYVQKCINDLEENELINIELIELIEQMANNACINNLKHSCQDVLKVFEYITDFKNNSIENFKDECNCREGDLQLIIDEEIEENKEHNIIINSIIAKTENLLTSEELEKIKILIVEV